MRPDCGAILLAGGRSSRMGTPKEWLEFDGRPLMQILVERLQASFPEPLVVAAPGQDLPPTPARRVDDDAPGEGPMAGLAVGLREISAPLAFVVSCDVPFLNPDLGPYLAGRAEGVQAVVPEWQGRLQPLQAVYRTDAQTVVTRELAAGRRRVTDLVKLLQPRVIPEAELRRLDPDGRTFLNVNRPEEYRQAVELWRTVYPR